jgi:uncharacterized membrane protein (DUF2068 family)
MRRPSHRSRAPRPPSLQRQALRGIALFEGLKGLAALVSGIGLIGLLHHDLRHLVLELVGHFGLNPAHHFPAVLLHYVDVLNSTPLSTLELLLTGYVLIRLAEAYGLWNDRAWAEWLGALSSGVYIPFEVRHLWHQPTVISAAILGLNLLVVMFLARQLWKRRAMPAKQEAGAA